MFPKIQFAMTLLPGEAPVLYTNPVQIKYPDTGYEPALHDYYKSRFLGRDVLFDRVQSNDDLPLWEFYCDDDFLAKALPYNELATALSRTRVPRAMWGEIYIAGPVVAFFRCDPRTKFPDLFPWASIEVKAHDDAPRAS